MTDPLLIAQPGIPFTKEELQKEAATVARSLVPGEKATVVALFGDLGAGKTTFTQAFAKTLGVAEGVTSPTFVIEKRYPLENGPFKTLIHIDAYRLDDAEDLRKLGWEEDESDKNNLIVIEWADKIAELLPKNALRIDLAFLDEEKRLLSYGNR